jgi:hypothetical protein
MKSAVTKLKGIMKIVEGHCAEKLEISFEEQAASLVLQQPTPATAKDPKSVFVIQSDPLRKCSQAVALSTVVDPPTEEAEQHPSVQRWPPTGSSLSPKLLKKKRKLLQLEDSEDEFADLPSQAQKENEIEKKEDFGFEFSIENMKRAYGVIQESDPATEGNTHNDTSIEPKNNVDHQNEQEMQLKKQQRLHFIGKSDS